jgi:thiosulfate reductase cytochrome b subunit
MHWINAVAIFIMIGSGWKIYNDDILFSFLRFPDAIVMANGRSTACNGTSSACGFSSSTASPI